MIAFLGRETTGIRDGQQAKKNQLETEPEGRNRYDFPGPAFEWLTTTNITPQKIPNGNNTAACPDFIQPSYTDFS